MTMHDPPHPGEFITEVYLEPSGLSGRSPESWLAIQHSHDLWRARQQVDLSRVAEARLTAA